MASHDTSSPRGSITDLPPPAGLPSRRNLTRSQVRLDELVSGRLPGLRRPRRSGGVPMIVGLPALRLRRPPLAQRPGEPRALAPRSRTATAPPTVVDQLPQVRRDPCRSALGELLCRLPPTRRSLAALACADFTRRSRPAPSLHTNRCRRRSWRHRYWFSV